VIVNPSFSKETFLLRSIGRPRLYPKIVIARAEAQENRRHREKERKRERETE